MPGAPAGARAGAPGARAPWLCLEYSVRTSSIMSYPEKKENLTIMDYVINIKESIIHLSLPKFRKCWKILEINLGLLRLQMGMPNFFLFNKHWKPGETGWSHSWVSSPAGWVQMFVVHGTGEDVGLYCVSFSSFESLGKHRALGNTSQTLQNPRWWPRVVGLLWFIYIYICLTKAKCS